MIRFQNVAARAALALLLFAIAIALAAGIGTRLQFWNVAIGQFEIFPCGLGCALAAILAGLVWVVVGFCSGSGTGARYGVTAILAAIALFWVPLRDYWMTEVVQAVPPIHDISTDTEHAPPFLDSGGAEPGAKDYDGLRRVQFEGRSYAAEALQKLYYGDISKPTWQLGATADKLFPRALAAARDMGWRIVAVEPDGRNGGRIQATDTTWLFGLTDDIVIRVRPAGIGARLDIRSRSREDSSDLGRNAVRIRAYLKHLASG